MKGRDAADTILMHTWGLSKAICWLTRSSLAIDYFLDVGPFATGPITALKRVLANLKPRNRAAQASM